MARIALLPEEYLSTHCEEPEIPFQNREEKRREKRREKRNIAKRREENGEKETREREREREIRKKKYIQWTYYRLT